MSSLDTLLPAPVWMTLKQRGLVFFDPGFALNTGLRGNWNVLGYENVKKVLSDHTFFSNAYVPRSTQVILSYGINVTDPPRHQLMRAIHVQALKASPFSNLEPIITRCCERLLQALEKDATVDFIEAFARRLPLHITASLLGLPEAEHEQVGDWARALIGDSSKGPDAYFLAQQEITAFFEEQFRRREREPKPDVLTHLLLGEYQGERLDPEECISAAMNLLIAGTESTVHLLAGSLACLSIWPEHQQQLTNSPQQIPAFVNEVLRYLSPVQCMYRLATADVSLGGETIRAGEFITAWIGAANRDGEKFEQADRFLSQRSNNGEAIPFGSGVHHCLGAPLAKLEAKIAIQKMLARFQHIRINSSEPLQLTPTTVVYGLKALPLSWEPAP